jgi:hypothetical protein
MKFNFKFNKEHYLKVKEKKEELGETVNHSEEIDHDIKDKAVYDKRNNCVGTVKKVLKFWKDGYFLKAYINFNGKLKKIYWRNINSSDDKIKKLTEESKYRYEI